MCASDFGDDEGLERERVRVRKRVRVNLQWFNLGRVYIYIGHETERRDEFIYFIFLI